MIENIFGFIVLIYIPLLLVAVFLGVVIYRCIVLPYLGLQGYSNKLAYRRVTEFRQIARAAKLMKSDGNPAYVAVFVLKHFELIILRHTYKVLLLWFGFCVLSVISSFVGI